MRSQPARLILASLLSMLALTAHAAPVFNRLSDSGKRLLARATAVNGTLIQERAGVSLLTVDTEALAAFRGAGGGTLSVPDVAGGTLDLELEPYDLMAPGASVTTSDETGRHPFVPDVSLFRGHVAGDPTSWVVLSMSGAGVLGTIEQAGQRRTLTPAQGFAPEGSAQLGVHALAPEDTEAISAAAARWTCGINADNERAFGLTTRDENGLEQGMTFSPEATQLNGTRIKFTAAVDCDQEIYGTKFGSNLTAATAYIMTLLGTVNLIYERDVEGTLEFTYINLWTSADPYNALNTSDQLSEFRAYWLAANPSNAQLRHLISGRALGGGIAFLDAACSNAYAVSAIDAAYSYPTTTTTWDAVVVSHEWGHNLGSPHTHSCTWQAEGRWTGTLDSCVAAEGSCATYSNHVPVNKGTIMSYCHLIGGTANGVRLEFHPTCVSRMRGIMSNCGAIQGLGGTVAPPRNPTVSNIPTGVRLAWISGGGSGILRYSVYRARLPLDLAAVYQGSTTGLSYDSPGLGKYYYRMRAVRSADSSTTSGELTATACSFASIAPVTVGSQPTAALSEDVNEDGINDVVLVTTGGGNLVTLIGQGAAGVGNGNFAAPVNVVTGGTPTCLALHDINGDGILDAIVGAQADNTLQLHLGQGTGGVGNGTFGAATLLATLDFLPTGIALGDFDEDGIADLAVAGGGNFVVTLKGNGTAGVPNGTFAAAVSIPTVSLTRGVLAYDLNGDGITDLAVTGSGLRLLFGNGTGGKGDGTFTLSPTNYAVGSTPNQLATGDFDLDGITDLAVANTGASTVSVLLGNGTSGVPNGTFQTAIGVIAGAGPNAVNVADWDHDGRPDLAVASNNGANTTSIMIGLGNGQFEAAQTFATGGSSPAFIAVNDFNEDGTPDLLACNRLSQSFTRQLAGCPGILSSALAIVSPNGGEVWNGGSEQTITWTKGAAVMTVDLQRSDDDGTNWRTLARGLPGTSYSFTAAGPTSTQVRFRVVDPHASQFSDASNASLTIYDASVLDVAGGPPKLALLGAWPNPARQDLAVSFALPLGGARGTLELIDLAGRRVASADLSGLSAGRHRVALLERRAVTPGVYLVRLTHGGEVKSLKVAVLR